MEQSQNKLIIFDMDGVIINSISLMEGLHKYRNPLATREDFEQLFTNPSWEQVDNQRMNESKKNETDEQKAFYLGYTKQKTETAQVYEGIDILIRSLKKEGYQLAINTSALDENTFPLLKRLSLDTLFDTILTRNFTQSKSEKFEYLLEHYQVNREDVIFITDTLADLKEAQHSSIPTIAVTWGVHSRTHFEENPEPVLLAVVDTVLELEKELLKRKK